ncbi:MAG: hypothetical protein Q8S09_13165, partial [Hyphomonas sp.]|nr:hypothetical protein [Hyphomonas sp.]
NAEARLTDTRAREQRHMITEQTAVDRYACADGTIPAYLYAGPDDRIGTNNGPFANCRVSAHDGAGANLRLRMNAGARRYRRPFLLLEMAQFEHRTRNLIVRVPRKLRHQVRNAFGNPVARGLADHHDGQRCAQRRLPGAIAFYESEFTRLGLIGGRNACNRCFGIAETLGIRQGSGRS